MWELFKWLFDKKDSKSSESKSWSLFSTIKDILGLKNEEQSKSSEETTLQLNELKLNLASTASYFKMEKQLTESDIDNSLNNKDISIQDIIGFGWDKWQFRDFIDEMIEKIGASNTLTSNLEKLKTDSMFSFLTNSKSKIVQWFGSFLDKNFGKDTEKLYADINKDLKELRSWTSLNYTQNPEVITWDFEWDGTIEWLKNRLIIPLAWNDVYVSGGIFGDPRVWHKHVGIDIWGQSDSIIAPATMKIMHIAHQEDWAWHYVKAEMIWSDGKAISNNGNKVIFNFFHLSKKPDLDIGTIINQGQVFAEEWNTWRSDGKHLHYEIQIGNRKVDPLLAYQGEDLKYRQDGKIVAFHDWRKAIRYENHSQAA